MKDSFVHLHTHSEFSLLDGAIRIKELVRKVKEMGMQAVALTDHGSMYGAIEFYTEAKQAGIKPIIGCEVYVAPKSRFDKASKEDKSHHLVLLARDAEGYRNLMKLVSKGFLEGFYYRPRVDRELLIEHSNGLIALSACLSGQIPKLIARGKLERAEQVARELQDIFGKGNFYLEIMDQHLESQMEINEKMAEISERTGIPLVATNDVHYLEKADHTAHDVLLCIQTGSTVDEADRLRFSSSEFYLRTPQEMKELMIEYPQALENTLLIAEMCNLSIELDQTFLPHYEPPEGYDLDTYLEKICWENLPRRYPEVTPEIEERLKKELATIKEMGFSGYFLIVWDFINYAKSQKIMVGPGRGSAAGSIVSYILGITNVDPLKYGLLFERFLNPDRRSLPDIDIDFCYERRDEVLKYVAEKYGHNRVAQIITFSTMAARAAVRDAGRVFGVPYGRVDRLAKLIPMTLGMTLAEALEMVPELASEYEENPETRKILDTAMKLEGLVRQDSIHAAGVVISVDDLTDFTPLQRKTDPEIVTQYKMEDIQKIGLLKMDFLGLKTLTMIDKAVKIIKRTRGVEIDLDNLDLNDQMTYDMISRGETLGVFQLESSGMRALVVDLKPNRFEDIIALLALYRPGPLQSGMVKDFVAAKHGRKKIIYPHPSLEPILKETYGIIVYQEQVMMIASKMAGFSMSEADILRGAISKKKRQLLAEQRDKFIGGAVANGYSEKVAEKVFDLVNLFAEYGFNKSHSTAYALISYQTAYLKAHYPIEFMAALLTERMGSKEKVAQYVVEAKRMGIEILPPDVNESYGNFTVVGDKIRFGLTAIANVGENVINSVVQERKQGGPYKSFYDFCSRIDPSVLNKRVVESLIKAGAFDSLGYSRKYLMMRYEKVISDVLKSRKDMALGQFSLFGTQEAQEFFEEETTTMHEEYSKEDLMALEKEILGLYVSDHPLMGLEGILKEVSDVEIADLEEAGDGSIKTIVGIISKIQKLYTKKGELMLFVTVEDMTSSVEVIVFPALLERYQDDLYPDNIVAITGRVDIKEDQVKIIANEVLDIEVEKEEEKSLTIKLKDMEISPHLIGSLETILKNYPGRYPVHLYLYADNQATVLRLGEEFKVKPCELLFAEIRDLLGDRVGLVIN